MAMSSVSRHGNIGARLTAIQGNLNNTTPMWSNVGSYLSASVKRQFATEGAYYGRPWKPLKPRYAAWKATRGYSGKILVQTGAMRASFVSRPMGIEVYSGKSAIFGSADQKAIWHQFGTHRNGKRVNPPRPMFVITAKVRQDVLTIMKEHILGHHHAGIRNLL